jgi:hypothetical protein
MLNLSSGVAFTRVLFARHPCKCGCRTRGTCRWRSRHASYHTEPLNSVQKTHLKQIQRPFTSPRVRDMLRLLMQKHSDMSENPAVILDVSQSIHMCGIRRDGRAPTLTCNGCLYAPALRKLLSVKHLATLMGFHKHVEDLAALPAVDAKRLLGNTMHVAVCGTLCTLAVAESV